MTIDPILGEKPDDPLAMYPSDVYTVPVNLAGLPAPALPVAMSREGLPIGIQRIGPAFAEERLFRAGAVLESRFSIAVPPGPPGAPESSSPTGAPRGEGS